MRSGENCLLAIAASSAIAVLAGCIEGDARFAEAMPLKGVHVVVADEFDGPAPWKPEAIGSMDYALASMIKARYNWGLAAAQDLTNALAKVTGCEVPLYFERDAPLTPGPVVYLGPVKAASAAGIDGADMMAGEWRITCDGKCAFIYARTTMGAAYGVTDFLARYADYHFVTIEGDDPYVVNPAASVPVVDFRAKHAVYARHFSVTTYLHSKPWLAGTGDMLPAYMRRTGCHVTPEIEGWVRPSLACGRHCHTFFSHLSPKDYFKEHPEYFSMDDTGKRVPRMLCLSNPDVKRIVTERIFSFIAKDRAENPENPPTLYDFSQEDSCGFLCRCPECKKLIAKYGGDSGLLLWFVNDLARTVRAKYPDVTIRTFAYVSTETVPVGIKPEPNIMFWLCDLYSKCDHELPLSHPLNARYQKLFKDWSAFAPKLEIWDYMLSDATFPEVSVDAIASDTRYFHDLGISRIYHQNPFGGQPLWELDTYVCSKLFRDPDADLERAVDEYCAVYGKGARKMREAIDFLRDAIAKNPPESVDAWHQRALPWRKRAVMEKFRDLVRAAHDAEDAPRSRTRTALAMRCVSRELMRITNNEGDIAACEAAKRDFLAASEELCGKKLFAGIGKAKLMAYSTDEADLITFRFKRLPKGLESVPASEIHCLDVRSCPWIGGAAGGNKKVADPESECPKVVRVAPRSRDKLLSPVQVRECPVSWARKKEFAVKPVAGGGYRWHRVGVARIGRASDCCIQPAHISFAVGSRYIECDGMAEDPNWYEFWLSVKLDGDPFSTNEKEGLFVDRLLLRRVKKPHDRLSCDVAVVGGGSAGFAAAWSAAKRGADVVLVEREDALGGTSTIGGVSSWEPVCGAQGLPELVYERLKKEGQAGVYRFVHHGGWPEGDGSVRFPGALLEIDRDAPYSVTLRRHGPGMADEKWFRENCRGVIFDPDAMSRTMREMLDETGRCRVMTGTSFVSAERDGGRITTLRLSDGTVLEPKTVVDACGAVAKSVGCELMNSDRPNGASLIYRVARSNGTPAPCNSPQRCWWREDYPSAFCMVLPNGEIAVNMLPTISGEEVRRLGESAAYEESRRRVEAHWRWMQTKWPAFSGWRISRISPRLAYRETFRVRGDYVLTGDDVWRGVRPSDEIASADHAFDSHGGEGFGGELKAPYGIPYRCLVAAGVDNLLLAGRIASFDTKAASSCRLSRTMMKLGEAAGAAAALSVQGGKSIRQVDAAEIGNVVVAMAATGLHGAEKTRRFVLADESRPRLHYWDSSDPAKCFSIPGERPMWDLKEVGDMKYRAVCKKGFKVFDLRERKVVDEFVHPLLDEVTAVCDMPDGGFVASVNPQSGSEKGKVVLLRRFSAARELVATYRCEGFFYARSLQWDRDGKTLLLSWDKGFARIRIPAIGDVCEVVGDFRQPKGRNLFDVVPEMSGDGYIAGCGYKGGLVRFDKDGKAQSVWFVPEKDGCVSFFYAQTHEMSDGHVYMAHWTGHGADDSKRGWQVVEFDGDGRVVWHLYDPKRFGSISGIDVLP